MFLQKDYAVRYAFGEHVKKGSGKSMARKHKNIVFLTTHIIIEFQKNMLATHTYNT